MTGDFSRVTFRPANHYTGVLQQQGRVQLDADHNEQVDIDAHRDRSAARDIVGDSGTSWTADAFRIVVAGDDFVITPGRMYVDGIACELEGDAVPVTFEPAPAPGGDQIILLAPSVDQRAPVADEWVRISGDGGANAVVRVKTVTKDGLGQHHITLRGTAPGLADAHPLLERVATYLHQPDLPAPPALVAGNRYLVYLDVWQRLMTALERPEIREVALGGPDTAARTKVVWQVKLKELDSSPPCSEFGPAWARKRARSSSRLRAQDVVGTEPQNVCDVPTGGGYRRLENQLYRVEIHSGAPTPPFDAKYKWSRDNATVVARLETINPSSTEITVSSVGRDSVLRFSEGQLVEVVDEKRTLNGQSGALMKVSSVEGNRLSVTAVTGESLPADFDPNNALVRRWDGSGKVPAALDLSKWLELEDGLQVQFNEGVHRPGDYWLVPARTLTNKVQWPRDAGENSLFLPPHGIEHRYAALAIATSSGNTPSGNTWTVTDCRERFPALSELTQLQYLSGDGQQAMPGHQLAGPLRVAVTNGQWGVQGARVRFRVTKGAVVTSPPSMTDGAVSQSGTLPVWVDEVEVSTGADGTAQCFWRLADIVDPQQLQSYPHQSVEAVLLDDHSMPDARSRAIVFNAFLSVASQVNYVARGCPAVATTVQDALERLCRFRHLEYVGGDGQSGLPDTLLTYPLRVGVTNGEGRVKDATVRFVATGGGTLNHLSPVASGPGSGSNILLKTDDTGVAECTWQLGKTSSPPAGSVQLVVATLDPAPDDRVPLEIRFTATLLPPLADGGADAGVAITRIILRGNNDNKHDEPLDNDINVPAERLAFTGIGIFCDKPVDPLSLNGKPVFALTLEIPYPLGADDFAKWGYSPGEAQILGYEPLVLAGETKKGESDKDIVWVPSNPTSDWLSNKLFQKLKTINIARVLARLKLQGNFVWSPDRIEGRVVYVDGDVGGEHRKTGSLEHTGLLLPSGDGLRGGDFDMWFWIVTRPKISSFVITPAITQGNTATGTITLSSVPSERMEVVVVPTNGAITSPTELKPLVFAPGETTKSFPFTVTQWGQGFLTLQATLDDVHTEARLTHRVVNIERLELVPTMTVDDKTTAAISLTNAVIEATTVQLSASGLAFTPSSVVFNPGQQIKAVVIHVQQWAADDTFTLRATLGNSMEAVLSRLAIKSFTVKPTFFRGTLLTDRLTLGSIELTRAPGAARPIPIVATAGAITVTAPVFAPGETTRIGIQIKITRWEPSSDGLADGEAHIRAMLGTSQPEVIVRISSDLELVPVDPLEPDVPILVPGGPVVGPIVHG